MLIEFNSEVGKLSMFGEDALQLLRMMGHSGTVPSAILARDIPAAVARLEGAVGSAPSEPQAVSDADDDDSDKQPKVSLHQRAFPLIDLLKRAAEKNADVMWKKE